MASIKTYQDAYEIAINKFKKNKHTLAVVIYGSMVSGDIWEESDMDFLLITREQNKTDSIYSKVLNVPVHINYMSKDIFIETYKSMLKGGTFHGVFFSAKLVYCVDEDVREIYNLTRFYNDKDIGIRNIELVCNLLNSIHYAKKFKVTGKTETAYQWCVEVLKNYARLIMNVSGHITHKDILSLAVSMNRDIEDVFKVLIGKKPINDKLNYIIDFSEEFIQSNIENIAKSLITYLEVIKTPCSATDIQNCDEFKQVDGDLNILLEKLSSMNLIMESNREYKSCGNEYLIDQIVYFKK